MSENENKMSQSGAAKLIERMLKKELFVINNESMVSPALLADNLEAHLRYLITLEKKGILFASGPLFMADGQMTGAGLTIVRAASFEEAERLANEDPFVISGQRRPTVRRWIVNEGRISVSIDLSDASATLT